MKFTRAYLLILIILLLAIALRMYRLDFFSLRGDESFTVLFVQKPLAQMWQETLTIEPNPPLLYFVLRGWILVTGDGEFATRFFSAFFGVLCIPLIYRLAREIFEHVGQISEFVPLTAAFLIAINPYQIWHSQDVRNYAMWPALSLLALVFFWRWFASPSPPAPRPKGAGSKTLIWLAAFLLAELAALYAHYYEAFLLLALNLFVFATVWRERSKLVQWIGAQIILAVLYLPYPLILSNRVSAYGEGSGRQGVALWDIARETFSTFTLGETLDAMWRAWLWIPFALVGLAGLVYLFRRDWKRGLFFLLYAGVPTLAVFGLNLVRPLYLERYLNGIAPAYYLLIANGLVQGARIIQARVGLPQVRRGVLAGALALSAVLAFFALNNYWTNPVYAKSPDWRRLAGIIDANAQRGDIIVQNFPETSLVYYVRTTFAGKLPLVVYPETFLPNGKTTQQLNALNANYQRAWFIPAAPDFWDPDQFVQGWLDHHDDLLNEWQPGDFDLRLYGTPSSFLNTMQPSNAVFGDVLRLSGYRAEARGTDLRLVLYWRALQTTDKSFEIQLRARNGAQSAGTPVSGTYPTTQWRGNELVVDQHDISNAAQVQEISLSVCEPNSKTCLPVNVSSGTASESLVLTIAP